MRVRCDYQCGFRQDGQPLLQEGLTVLDEATLTFGEREFIKVMVDSKLAEIVPEQAVVAPPVSETKLVEAPKHVARKRAKAAR